MDAKAQATLDHMRDAHASEREAKRQAAAQAKRAVWDAMQTAGMGEGIREFSETFGGIAGVSVTHQGKTLRWGDTGGHQEAEEQWP